MQNQLKPEDFPFIQQRIYNYADFIRTQVNIFMPAIEKLYSIPIEAQILDDYNSFVYNAFAGYVTAIDGENTKLTKKLQQCTKDLKQYVGEQKQVKKQIAGLEKKASKDAKACQCLEIARKGDEELEKQIEDELQLALHIEEEYEQLSVKFYRSFNPQLMDSRYEFILPVKKNGRGPIEDFRGKIGEFGTQQATHTNQEDNRSQQVENYYPQVDRQYDQEAYAAQYSYDQTPDYEVETNIDYYNE